MIIIMISCKDYRNNYVCETFSTSLTVERNYLCQFLIDFSFLSNYFYLKLRSKIIDRPTNTMLRFSETNPAPRMAPFDIFV